MKKSRKLVRLPLTIIKMTLAQLLIATTFSLAAFAGPAEGQEILKKRVTYHANDQEIKKVLKGLEKLTEVYFTYSSSLVKSDRKITVNAVNEELGVVLNTIFQPMGVTFLVNKDKHIILQKAGVQFDSGLKETESTDTPGAVFELITGKVTDKNGLPIEGVTVTVKGKQLATVTKTDGTFSIDVADASDVLVFSYVGFAPMEKQVGNSKEINVILAAVDGVMDDVVVIGYGTMKRKDLTGSVSSLKSRDITAIPVTNALEAMQGKVSGLDITKSDGGAGAPVRINLRGNRSLTASNDPLILVDGIPYGSTLDLNTSDIESMEVLKDASSTAIYGSRGANGVILITTKKGKSGKPSLSLSSYYGVQSPAGLAEIQTGDQFVAFKREAFRTAGITDDNLIFNPGELAAIKDKIYVDWMREAIKDGSIQNHELSVNGGNDRSTYNMSFGAFNEKGLFRNDNFKRYNGSLGLSYKLLDNVKIGANVLYTYKNVNKRFDPLNQANKIYPFGSPYDSAGNIVAYPVLGQTFSISPLADEVPGMYVDNRVGKRLFTTAYLDWRIMKDLVFKTSYGLDIQNDRRGYYLGKLSIQRNGGLSNSGIETNNTTNYTWENTLNYSKTLGIHDLNFLLGNSIIKNSLESVAAAGFDQVSDLNTFYNLASNASSVTINSSLVESGLQSFFGRINYKLNDKYLLTASLRADGASVLAEGHKWAYFPSLAAGWRISDEDFMKNVTFLSNLKLRASYGVSGNSSVLPYQTLGSLGRSVYAFDETAAYGYFPNDISNPDLKWEKTATTNAGIDFGLFSNRITGSVEVYQSKTSDLLLQRILPTTSGFSRILENVGKTQNKGLEITVSTVNINSTAPGGLKWYTDLTYFRNREEIVELAGGVSRDLANSWFVGQPTQVYYDYQKTGIWQLGKESEAAVYGQKPGDIQVKDINNDNKITAADDRVIVGTARPKYTFGINNNVQFRNFDLTAFVFGRMGQTIQNEASGNYKISGLENGPVVDYWTPENPTNSHPRPNKDKNSNSAFMSTLYYADGSFVKIRDITLGYSVPASAIQRYSLSRIRVYATLKNFFTFSNMNPYDPERGGSISFPMTKQVVFGLNVNFK
jgi:TonB-linked SusC/RagA family outer membrane protein